MIILQWIESFFYELYFATASMLSFSFFWLHHFTGLFLVAVFGAFFVNLGFVVDVFWVFGVVNLDHMDVLLDGDNSGALVFSLDLLEVFLDVLLNPLSELLLYLNLIIKLLGYALLSANSSPSVISVGSQAQSS